LVGSFFGPAYRVVHARGSGVGRTFGRQEGTARSRCQVSGARRAGFRCQVVNQGSESGGQKSGCLRVLCGNATARPNPFARMWQAGGKARKLARCAMDKRLRIFRDFGHKRLPARSALECGSLLTFSLAGSLLPAAPRASSRQKSGSKLPHSKADFLSM
jgi:hypothetical protein